MSRLDKLQGEAIAIQGRARDAICSRMQAVFGQYEIPEFTSIPQEKKDALDPNNPALMENMLESMTWVHEQDKASKPSSDYFLIMTQSRLQLLNQIEKLWYATLEIQRFIDKGSRCDLQVLAEKCDRISKFIDSVQLITSPPMADWRINEKVVIPVDMFLFRSRFIKLQKKFESDADKALELLIGESCDGDMFSDYTEEDKKEFVLAKIACLFDESNFPLTCQALQNDKRFVLAVISGNPCVLQFVNKALRDDMTVVLAAVGGRVAIEQHVGAEEQRFFPSGKTFSGDPSVIQFASLRLQQDQIVKSYTNPVEELAVGSSVDFGGISRNSEMHKHHSPVPASHLYHGDGLHVGSGSGGVSRGELSFAEASDWSASSRKLPN